MAKASEDDEITQKRYREKRTEHGHWKQSQQKRPGEKHPKQEYDWLVSRNFFNIFTKQKICLISVREDIACHRNRCSGHSFELVVKEAYFLSNVKEIFFFSSKIVTLIQI